MSKTCSKCKQQKPINEFNKRKDSRDGLDIYCRTCKLNYTNEWKLNNQEKLKESKKIADANWYVKNKQRKIEINAKWKQNNEDHVRGWHRKYKKEREAIDPSFKIANKIRNRLWYALRGKKKNCKFDEYTGCDRFFLVKHLESLFEPDMTWDNYGEWEIDHIEPLCEFDLSNEDELKNACNYKNLQPIWKKEHKKKTLKDLLLRKNIK